MAFTDYSRPSAMIHPNRKGHPRDRDKKKMTIWTQLTTCAFAIREFIAPTYRPERHYMRGPGPACARRRGMAMDSRASFQ